MIHHINRRQLLSAAVVTVTSAILPSPPESWAGKSQRPRSLSLYHAHTGKKLDITYGSVDGYEREALIEIDHFLKDFRTGDVHPIDLHLLDLLFSIDQSFGGKKTFEVVSGYRSPRTNRQLGNTNSKVAKHSLHMEGKAIDIRLTGVRTEELRRCALKMKGGGVGSYPKSDFIHLDTGQVRSW